MFLFQGQGLGPIHEAVMGPRAAEFIFTGVAIVLILVRYVCILSFPISPSQAVVSEHPMFTWRRDSLRFKEASTLHHVITAYPTLAKPRFLKT